MNMRGGFSTFSVVPAVGVGVTNAMMLSTIPPILAARHRGSLKRGASVAHLALVFPSCVAWTVFALATKNPYIFLSNGPGVLIGIFLFLSGMRLGSRAQRDQLESFALGSGVLMLGSGAAMGVFGSESNLGALLANCLSILFYLSPIPVLREALRTRSARALQMPMAATSLVNSALWTAYGLNGGGLKIIVPSCLGLAVSSLQLGLLFAFRRKAASWLGHRWLGPRKRQSRMGFAWTRR
eukprot:CAMPEP_0172588468 /NCGR_PEP_ID=MMETSP1068-20121228/7370_1 /TAXON_ID=35684 /ORGANISM="Pseudopedinella elastica, Strain CCMP716" /LENGTH=238 /DNA_ID=CAMNT_0013383803 /DNA_START=277 /DNA_END=993 /DNA_ORIENTATION=-